MGTRVKEGDYAHIKMSQVIASCKMRLRLESSDDDIFIERYANEGARHFDSLSTFIKRECEIEVVNGKGRLPNGFYQLLSCSPCDGSNFIYVDQPFLRGCGISGASSACDGQGIFQIQDGWIYFTANQNFSKDHGITVLGSPPISGDPNCNTNNGSSVQNGPVFHTFKLHISFIGMNVDDDGMMVVYADMERGLVAYCVWMYMLDSPAGKYTAQQIQANEMIWNNQATWYRSKEFQNNFRNTRRQVASIANAWVVQKQWYI